MVWEPPIGEEIYTHVCLFGQQWPQTVVRAEQTAAAPKAEEQIFVDI